MCMKVFTCWSLLDFLHYFIPVTADFLSLASFLFLFIFDLTSNVLQRYNYNYNGLYSYWLSIWITHLFHLEVFFYSRLHLLEHFLFFFSCSLRLNPVENLFLQFSSARKKHLETAFKLVYMWLTLQLNKNVRKTQVHKINSTA